MRSWNALTRTGAAAGARQSVRRIDAGKIDRRGAFSNGRRTVRACRCIRRASVLLCVRGDERPVVLN